MDDNKKTNRILIVDDEPELARIIETTLKFAGLETCIAHTGTDAIRIVHEDPPDVILLDMVLPNMSGLEVCQILKSDPSTSSIKIIFLTGQSDQDDFVAGITAGADEYLTKPFSPTELINLITMALSDEIIVPQKRRLITEETHPEQMYIYAQEVRELYEKEHAERLDLEAAQAKLNEVENFKATLLNAVTHELLTPFTPVGLALQVMQQHSVWWPQEHRDSLDELSEAIAKLHKRINGLVKCAELITKRRDPQRGYYRPYDIIQRPVEPAAVLAQSRNIDLRVLIPRDLPQIHVDPELIGEAIFQMVHNAIIFNSPGGWVRINASAKDEHIVYDVSDNGIGVTKERQETLGQPFSQTTMALQRGKEGLGVGWAFVVYVAEAHNGWVKVESPGPGHGSVFSLAIPQSNALPATGPAL